MVFRRFWSAVLALGLLAVQGPGLGTQPLLRVTDLTAQTGVLDGEVILCRPFPVEGVVLVYTHSMFGGDVQETFVPANGMLRRVEMTTANGAAADYYAFTASVTRVGDRYRIKVPPAEFTDIVVRVDDVGSHRLMIGDETVDLLAMTGQAHRVRFDLVTSSWVSRLWSRRDGC